MNQKACLKRLLIIWMAVTGLILMNACSRSGGPKDGDAQPIQQPSPAARGAGSELDAHSSKSSQEGPLVQHGPHGSASEQSKSRKTETEILDPSGLSPAQIFGKNQKKKSGPLKVVGAGRDTLRGQLEFQTRTQTPANLRTGDQEFANAITSASFDMNWGSRRAQLVLSLQTAQGVKKFFFNGTVDNKLILKSGSLTRDSRLMVEASCMDLNGGCETVYAKIQDGSASPARTAHVIIRTTSATVFMAAHGADLSRNAEFRRLYNVIARTARDPGSIGSLDDLVLRTTEVINGKSTFKLELGIRTGARSTEQLDFGGELVKIAGTTSLESPVAVLRASSTSAIAETIRSVTLTQNDGHGDLTLSITVRKGTAAAVEETMDLTVARIHKPVRDLEF